MIALLCVGLCAHAWPNNDLSSKDVLHLIKLLPDRITQNEVKASLGEATIINVNHKTGELLWHYAADDEDVYVKWDMKSDKLKEFTYSSHKSSSSETKWANRYVMDLEMGVSSLQETIRALGMLRMASSRSGEQWLKYAYADNSVDIQFKNNVLVGIKVSYGNK